jgi:hypothetical protein
MATLGVAAYFGSAAIFLSSSATFVAEEAPFATSARVGGGDKGVASAATALGFFACPGREMVDA